MGRGYGNGLSIKEYTALLEKDYEEQIDSDTDETVAELGKPVDDDAKFILMGPLDGMVHKRQRTSVASLRVSKKVSHHLQRCPPEVKLCQNELNY